MQELHLVGFTTDHDALIFSARKGAKSGGFLVALDAKFYDTLDDAGRLRGGDDDGKGGKRRGARRPNVPRPESALSPRDIQMRLRAGRSVAAVASEAGVDEEWVLRFAAPIMAEQAQVVARAQGLTFSKARLGASGRALGEAVWWNIADKGVLMAQDTFDQCWTAQHLRDSNWIVRFDFVNRKKRQRAEWEVDIREATLTSRNRLASELGYIEPGRRGRPPAPLPPPAKPVVKKQAAAAPAPARATVAKRPPAKKRAAAKKKATTKRAPVKKKTTARRAPAKKKATTKRAPARRAAAKKKAATRRAAPKKSTVRRPAPKKVAKAKRPAPKKSVATRRPTPKKTPIKRAAAKRTAPRRPPAKKAARPRQALRVEAESAAEASFETPSFDTGEPTRPVTIRAPRASAPEPAPEPEAEPEVLEIDDFDNSPLPPPPVLTSTPRARAPRPAPPERRFGRLRRRRPPGS